MKTINKILTVTVVLGLMASPVFFSGVAGYVAIFVAISTVAAVMNAL